MNRRTSLIVLFIGALTFLRLFISIDLTDETGSAAQAVAFYYDKILYKSDLFLQSNSGALAYPITWLSKVILDWEGLFLHLRLLTFSIALLAFMAFYYFLRRSYSFATSLATASIFISYIPFSIAGWTYNNIGTFAAPLSLILWHVSGKYWAFAAGVFAAIACFAYAPLSLLFFIFLIFSLFIETRSRQEKVYLFLGFLLGSSAALLLLLGADPENIHRLREFTKAFSWSGYKKIGAVIGHFGLGFIRSGLILVLGLGWWYRERIKIYRREAFDVLVAITALLSCFSLPQATAKMGLLIYLPISLAILLYFISWPKQSLKTLAPREKQLLAFGFGIAAIFGYTTSNTFINFALGMLLPGQLIMLALARNFEEPQRLRYLLILPLLLSLGNYKFVYRDGPIYQLTHRIESGPYKNIFTTAEKKAYLNQLQADMAPLTTEPTTVFASYMAPVFLLPNVRPMTGMLFVHDGLIYSEKIRNLVLYQTIDEKKWPDLVVAGKLEQRHGKDPYRDFYLASGRYEAVVERDQYQIYKRKSE